MRVQASTTLTPVRLKVPIPVLVRAKEKPSPLAAAAKPRDPPRVVGSGYFYLALSGGAGGSPSAKLSPQRPNYWRIVKRPEAGLGPCPLRFLGAVRFGLGLMPKRAYSMTG